jgi:hypothetical protein
MTEKQRISIRSILGIHLDALFNQSKWLDPLDWTMFIGFSDYLKKQAIPDDFKDKKRAGNLNIFSKYVTIHDRQPVKVIADEDSFRFILPDMTNDDGIIYHYNLERRVDLVLDNEQEFDACDFPYDTLIKDLSPAFREKVYKQFFFQIKPPPSDNPSGGDRFMITAAEKGTYKLKPVIRPYYAKWLDPKPTKNNRVFAFDNLSDEYLQENFHGFDLQKDKVYLRLKMQVEGEREISVLTMLNLDVDRFVRDPPAPDNSLGRQALLVSGIGTIGNHFDMLNAAIKIARNKKKKISCTAYFFYAITGTDKLPDYFNLANQLMPGVRLGNQEQVMDPQFMLQRMLGRSINDIEEAQKKWDYMRWVKELVRTQFSEHWIFFRNHDLGAFIQPDREKLFLKELREEVQKAQGPMKEKLAEFLKIAEKDASLHMIRRGIPFTKYDRHSRIAGADDYYIYLWNNHTRLFTRFPMSFLWQEISIGQTVEDIYQRTKGLVPMCKIVAWGGVAVIAFPLIGGIQAVTFGVRAYLGEKIRGLTVEALARLTGLYEDLKKRLLLMLIETALSIFPKKGDNVFFIAIGLIRGFLKGYTFDTYDALFKKWNAVATLEPSTFRAIKLLQRIESTLRKIDEKMSLLKNRVDEKAAKLLLERFSGSSIEIFRGIISMLNNLYFLEYEQVKEILSISTEINEAPPITKEQWDKLRHRHLVETFKKYDEQIRNAGKSVKELYDDIQNNIRIIHTAVGAVEAVMLFEAVNGGLLVAVFMSLIKPLAKPKVVAAATGTLFFLRGFDQGIKDIGGVVGKGLDYFLGENKSVERIERLGEIIGQIYGGITINKALFGKKTWTERWKEDGKNPLKFMGKALLRKELSVGLLMPALNLVLFKYVYLIEKVIKTSKAEWETLLKSYDMIIYGDPEFNDLIAEDQVMTVEKIQRLLNATEQVLANWLKQLAQIPDLTDSINKMVDFTGKIQPDKIPSFQELRDGRDIVDWSKEAFMFILLSHLHASVKRIADGFHGLQTAVTADKDISVLGVLDLLGFLQKGKESDETLDTGFDEIFVPEK